MLVRRFFGSPTGEWETPFEEMERLRQNLSRVLEALGQGIWSHHVEFFL
jgi:hypothetical protein